MNNRTRVLFFIHDLKHGGAEKVLVNLVNNMNIEMNKQYELILAIHAIYLIKHPELRNGELDFIETPNIKYMHDLEKLIPIQNYPEMIKYITNFTDCSVPIDLAIGMNDLYDNLNVIPFTEIDEFFKEYLK